MIFYIFYYVTLEEGRRAKQEGLNADLRTRTRENNSKGRIKDVIKMENNNSWQEEMHVKPGMSKANKSPLKKKSSEVKQPIETKNCYSPLQTEEKPTDNRNTITESLNKKLQKK